MYIYTLYLYNLLRDVEGRQSVFDGPGPVVLALSRKHFEFHGDVLRPKRSRRRSRRPPARLQRNLAANSLPPKALQKSVIQRAFKSFKSLFKSLYINPFKSVSITEFPLSFEFHILQRRATCAEVPPGDAEMGQRTRRLGLRFCHSFLLHFCIL